MKHVAIVATAVCSVPCVIHGAYIAGAIFFTGAVIAMCLADLDK